jgi:hypothetical protein
MVKVPQLVCQHLENISRDTLEKYQAIIKRYVVRRQGVYALYRRGKLYYVGLAGDLRWRVNAHLKDRHGHSWDRFSIYLPSGISTSRSLNRFCFGLSSPYPKATSREANSRHPRACFAASRGISRIIIGLN